MQYEIDIQKALSFPHCTGKLVYGDKRCAVGAVYSAINFDFKPFCQIDSGATVFTSSLIHWGIRAGINCIYDRYEYPNDQAKDDLERDLVRRRFITDLLACGAVVPCSKDTELAKELLERKEAVCQTD